VTKPIEVPRDKGAQGREGAPARGRAPTEDPGRAGKRWSWLELALIPKAAFHQRFQAVSGAFLPWKECHSNSIVTCPTHCCQRTRLTQRREAASGLSGGLRSRVSPALFRAFHKGGAYSGIPGTRPSVGWARGRRGWQLHRPLDLPESGRVEQAARHRLKLSLWVPILAECAAFRKANSLGPGKGQRAIEESPRTLIRNQEESGGRRP
jgi:hypothetical protein